jgi:TRAP-type C4-dicarboxylate transport system substrate-binding protein
MPAHVLFLLIETRGAMKKLSITLLAVIFVLAAGVIPARADKAIQLTYANFPPSSTFPCVQMERWAKEIEKRTNGKVKIKTFPGGTLLQAKNIYDGVKAGTADIGNFAMSYQPGRFPVSEALDLPHGFSSAKAGSLALYDLITAQNPKEFSDVKVITLFTAPPADIMTIKPVRKLSDLKGLELRVSGTGADILKHLGGIPVAMPQSDTPEALQKGIVKGSVSSLEVLKDMNYAAYCPYSVNANLYLVSFAVVMNKKKYDALPADVKKAIDDLARDQAEWTGAYVDGHVADSIAWAKTAQKHTNTAFTSAEFSDIARLVKPVHDDYIARAAKKGIDGKALIAEVNRLKAKYDKKGK